MDNLSYRLFFTQGSLSGKSFPLAPGASATVGRSRSCEIRAAEPDVSGRHVLLTADSRGVSLENLSSRATQVDGATLAMGESRQLVAGQSVMLGAELGFTLQSVAASAGAPATRAEPAAPATRAQPSVAATNATRFMESAPRTVLPPLGCDPATVAPDLYAPADDSGTQALKTRMATPEELDVLRETHVRQRRVKTGAYTFVGALVLAGLSVLYMMFANRPAEALLTLPKDAAGKEIRANAYLDENGPLRLNHPGSGQFEVTRPDADSLVVDCWVGREGDVPLRLELLRHVPPDNGALHATRAELFANWLADGQIQWTTPPEFLRDNDFIGRENGIRCELYKYKRIREDATGAKQDWTGLLAFFRSREACYFYLCELPSQEEFRGSRLIETPSLFLVATTPFVTRHWEGLPRAEQDDRPAAQLQREWEALIQTGKSADWERIERYLTSALIQTWPSRGEEPQKSLHENALATLEKSRGVKRQRAQQLLARRITAAALKEPKPGAEIDREAREYFNSPDDARYFRVRKEKWWEDPAWK